MVHINKVTVNTNKNKYIHFHKTHILVTDSLFSLYLNNISLEIAVSNRFLGVVIDECLSWKISNFSKNFQIFFYFL